MNITTKIRSLSRKAKFAVAILAIGVVAAPIVQAEFYPNRPVYDYNKHTPGGDCKDPTNPATQGGRCGSMNGPVFNSFVNTPSYGDERSFFDGRRGDQTVGQNADDIQNVTTGTKEVVLRTYVHNNANQETNASGVGVARDTKVRIALPTAEEQVLRARSYISASNAAMVEDTADLLGNEKFKVQYVPGSAKMLRNTSSYPLSDSIVTTGAQIGDNATNGNLPGCFEYAALVEIRVKVIVKETPNLQFFKEVRKSGETEWKKEVAAKPHEEVQYRLATKNISNYDLTNVTVRDVLPPHVQLVPGSVRIVDASQDTTQQDGPLFAGGIITAQTHQPGGIRYVVFKAKALGDFSECQIRVRNVAFSKSTQQPNEQESAADVVITRENCDEKPKPSYSCDLLEAVKGEGRTVNYTVRASANNGATIKNYVFDFGDGETLTTDKNTASHTYKTDGQYATRVKVNVQVGNEVKVAEGDQCAAVVNYNTPETPVTPGAPVTPGKLPETGVGSNIAIFMAVTAAAMAAYYAVVRRASNL